MSAERRTLADVSVSASDDRSFSVRPTQICIPNDGFSGCELAGRATQRARCAVLICGGTRRRPWKFVPAQTGNLQNGWACRCQYTNPADSYLNVWQGADLLFQIGG